MAVRLTSHAGKMGFQARKGILAVLTALTVPSACLSEYVPCPSRRKNWRWMVSESPRIFSSESYMLNSYCT